MIEIIPNWHPIFVHFTLALWTVAALFFVLAIGWEQSQWRSQWLHTAYWNLWLGAGVAVITAITGWLAYNSVAHDAPSHAAMTEHRNWATATLIVMLPLSAWSMWRYFNGKAPGAVFLLPLLIGIGLLASTGWHGGELVYRYGLGVMSLPAAEEPGHAHGHDHDHADEVVREHESMSDAPSAAPPMSSEEEQPGHLHVHQDGSVHEH
jgi:uncharacterized membrane protein